MDVSHLFLFLVFLSLGTMAYRNIPLYVFVTVPIVLSNLSSIPFSQKSDTRLSRWIKIKYLAIPVYVLCLFFILLNLFKEKQDNPDSNLAPFRYPVEAVKFLKTAAIPGNMFNSVSEGGYIMWEMFPQVHHARGNQGADGRLVIRSRPFFDMYLNVLDHPEKFYSLQKQYNITHVVLPISMNERYLNLAGMLYQDKQWRLIFVDATSVIFTNQQPFKQIDLGSPDEIQKITQGFNAQFGENKVLLFWANRNFENLLNHIMQR